MYRNSYQHGLLTVFSSGGSKPLLIWGSHVQNGHISTATDPDIKSQVVDVIGLNVTTTYITCPKNPKQSLGIHLPYLVMVIKNLHKYFTFEVTIMDESDCRRRFRVSNFQSTTTIHPFCTAMPIGLSGGWNQIQFNLAEFTRRAYKLQFAEVVRIQINANVRLRRIYFAERLYADDELPNDYKLLFPIKSSSKRPARPITKDIITEKNIEEKALSKQSLREAILRSEQEIVPNKSTASLNKETSSKNSQLLQKSSHTSIPETLQYGENADDENKDQLVNENQSPEADRSDGNLTESMANTEPQASRKESETSPPSNTSKTELEPVANESLKQMKSLKSVTLIDEQSAAENATQNGQETGIVKLEEPPEEAGTSPTEKQPSPAESVPEVKEE